MKSEEQFKLDAKVILVTETTSLAEPVIAAEKNTVGAVSFLHPIYSEHKTSLLS